MIEELMAIVRRCARVPADVALDGDTVLIGGGLRLDSMRVLELSVAIEERFGIYLGERDLGRFQTLGSLAALVECRLR